MTVLIDYFLDFYRRKFRKLKLDFSKEARRKLENYSFPGNVRELKNVVVRATALALSDRIESKEIFFQKSAGEDENIDGSIAPDRRAAAILQLDLNFRVRHSGRPT